MEVEVLDPARDQTDSDVRAYAQRLAEGDSTLLDEQDDAAGGEGANRGGRRGRRLLAGGSIA